MSRRIGIYTGTFDPVHRGHIAFCQAALEQCELDKIYIIPEHTPRRKRGIRSLSIRQRTLERALEGLDRIEMATLDEPQFTVKGSLPQLKRLAGPAEPVLLVGSDVARTLGSWDDIAELVKTMSLAIGLRRHDTPGVVKKVMQLLQQQIGLTPRYTIVDASHRFMASSYIQGIGHVACREVVDFSI
ncbi:cytidyltransferase-related domain [candidate division TM7 genomosp. GTL1]|nr:cytidyltransferase-related domain [candidate division TM7 genomosp. GTL1]